MTSVPDNIFNKTNPLFIFHFSYLFAHYLNFKILTNMARHKDVSTTQYIPVLLLFSKNSNVLPLYLYFYNNNMCRVHLQKFFDN